jgi:hypothetical protein
MTVWLVGSAAWAYRRRTARKAQAATGPHPQGKRMHQPTARGVLHDVVGMHVRCQAGQWPLVLQLTAAQQPWRRRRGQPSRWLDDVQES